MTFSASETIGLMQFIRKIGLVYQKYIHVRLSDLKINHTHGPVKHGSSNARWTMMIIIDQKHRVGKIVLSAKKSRGVHRHRNWLLDGSGWLSVLLMHKLNNGEHRDLTFNHPDCSNNPSWYAHRVVTWNRNENGYRAMRRAFEHACKKTGIRWAKCLHFRRQGTEDSQTNGAGDEEVTKMTGHGQNAFYKNYYTRIHIENVACKYYL